MTRRGPKTELTPVKENATQVTYENVTQDSTLSDTHWISRPRVLLGEAL